jgi:hypothetical protein
MAMALFGRPQPVIPHDKFTLRQCVSLTGRWRRAETFQKPFVRTWRDIGEHHFDQHRKMSCIVNGQTATALATSALVAKAA